jgi:hypothetical protein
MLHASTQKLIVKLCELTEAGHIAWKHGEGRTCTFETEGYQVEIQGQPPRLRLLHADGRELERADEIDLASQPSPGGEGTFASQISLLAERADRIARGAEHAISRILSSLSSPPRTAPFEYVGPQPATQAAEPPPPPAPHTMPGPPPDKIASDTAIDRVLAVESGPQRTIDPPASEVEPEPVVIESESAAIVGDPKPVEEVVEAAALTSVPAPPEAPGANPETVAIAAAPPPVKTWQPPVAAPAIVIPRPQQTFGATTSFVKPRDPSTASAAPRAMSPKPYSTSPLFFGVNQLREPARAEPEPSPVPPPTAKPVPAVAPIAEKKPQPAIAGPDIYKPWS